MANTEQTEGLGELKSNIPEEIRITGELSLQQLQEIAGSTEYEEGELQDEEDSSDFVTVQPGYTPPSLSDVQTLSADTFEAPLMYGVEGLPQLEYQAEVDKEEEDIDHGIMEFGTSVLPEGSDKVGIFGQVKEHVKSTLREGKLVCTPSEYRALTKMCMLYGLVPMRDMQMFLIGFRMKMDYSHIELGKSAKDVSQSSRQMQSQTTSMTRASHDFVDHARRLISAISNLMSQKEFITLQPVISQKLGEVDMKVSQSKATKLSLPDDTPTQAIGLAPWMSLDTKQVTQSTSKSVIAPPAEKIPLHAKQAQGFPATKLDKDKLHKALQSIEIKPSAKTQDQGIELDHSVDDHVEEVMSPEEVYESICESVGLGQYLKDKYLPWADTIVKKLKSFPRDTQSINTKYGNMTNARAALVKMLVEATKPHPSRGGLTRRIF